MLTCKEVTKLVSKSLDQDLPLGKRIAVRIHLMMCKYCARFKKQMMFLHRMAKELSEKAEYEYPDMPPLSDDARRRIKDRLSQNGSQS